MIFGNLESVFEGDRTIMEAMENSIKSQSPKKPSHFSKILKTLSHYGMNYSDKVYQNMLALEFFEGVFLSDEVGYFVNLAVCLDARNALHNKQLQVLLHRAPLHRHYRCE